jgi:hypothetical protein
LRRRKDFGSSKLSITCAQIGQPHMATRGQGDGGIGQIRRGVLVAQGADRLFADAEFGLARADIGIGQRKLLADRAR